MTPHLNVPKGLQNLLLFYTCFNVNKDISEIQYELSYNTITVFPY